MQLQDCHLFYIKRKKQLSSLKESSRYFQTMDISLFELKNDTRILQNYIILDILAQIYCKIDSNSFERLCFRISSMSQQRGETEV